MAPNRPSPQDEPPEEVEASSEEEVDGEEEEESGSESEEPEPKGAPTLAAEKKPPPKNPDLATVPQSSSPGSEEVEASSEEEVDREEEEESGSESEPEPPKAALAEKKPPPKKTDSAMENTPKPRSKASATTTPEQEPGRSGQARATPRIPRGPGRRRSQSWMRSRTMPEEMKKAGGDDSKKPLLLQRIWSDDDEITILEGMIDYYAKQGVHPNADMFAFHDFMKKSLKADVNKTQLQDKIRRLKKKYETNVAKGSKYNPVKPHELRVFNLSNKVWGSGEGSFAISGLSEQYKCNETGMGLRELRLLEDCLELIGEPKRVGLKEEWKKLHVAELELLAKRGELAKLILEALK